MRYVQFVMPTFRRVIEIKMGAMLNRPRRLSGETDMITFDPIPTRYLVRLSGKAYDVRSLSENARYQRVEGKVVTVPHTNVAMTDAQASLVNRKLRRRGLWLKCIPPIPTMEKLRAINLTAVVDRARRTIRTIPAMDVTSAHVIQNHIVITQDPRDIDPTDPDTVVVLDRPGHPVHTHNCPSSWLIIVSGDHVAWG